MVSKSIYEYGGKEVYSSKTAMMKHEKSESPKMEKAEKKMTKSKPKNLMSKRVKK